MDSQDTEKNLRNGRGNHPNSRANLRPFSTGGDVRRNVTGRPKNFDELRRLSQKIGAEETTDSKGNVMTRIEHILRKLAASSDPQALRIFLEYGFGRPVEKLDVNELEKKPVLVLHYAHERPISINGEGTRRPLLPGTAD